MVYELLVGRPPFQGGPGQVMRQHYQTPPPAPSTLNPRLSPPIDAVLLRALAKQPDERFASVTAFARAFKQAVEVSLPSRLGSVEPTLPVPPPDPGKQTPSVEEMRMPPARSDAPGVREPTMPAPPSRDGVLESTAFAAHAPLLPTEAATPARQTPLSTERSRSSTPTTIRSDVMTPTKPVKRSTSQRIVLIGLALLVVVALASGIAWLILPHNITEFALPTSQSGPEGIAVGPDGNLWFTEYYGDQIGRISTSGSITEFPIPTSQNSPYGITRGSDGNLWFTENGGNKIGRITTGK